MLSWLHTVNHEGGLDTMAAILQSLERTLAAGLVLLIVIVLLAGLVSETQNKSRSGIPLLDQLPGALGDTFSHQGRTTARTELIIFIRPQIIRDAVDAHLVAEELRAKLKSRVGTVSPKLPEGSSGQLPIR